MKRSEYRHTTFDVPSNRKLWDSLGEFDALMQYVEAACISYEEKQQSSGLTLEEFKKTEKDKMSHPISSLEFNSPREKLHDLYLVYPHSCLDVFIDEIIEDMRTLGFAGFNLAGTNNTSRLERLLLSLQHIGIIPNLYDFSLPVYTYYRYMRNGLNHNGGDDGDNTKVKNAYTTVYAFKAVIDGRFNYLDALGECANLQFGDYVLCTANIKNIADLIVLAIESHVDWDNFFLSVDNHPTIKKIKGYQRDKQVSHVKHVIKQTYAIDLSDDTCGKIVDNTIAHFE